MSQQTAPVDARRAPTSPEDDTRFCEAVIAEHSKSFSLASRLLSSESRRSAVATYAWCRRADDAVDRADSTDQARVALARLREELDLLEAGNCPDDPVLRAFAQVLEHRRMPIFYPRELLAGMEMDVVGHTYETMDDLVLYCYRVAGVVGLMMCHVLGISSDDALPHAAHLGMAMQLTNICRDVEEDRLRGRCYIPASLLAGDLCSVLSDRTLPALSASHRRSLADPVRELLCRAERYYRSGDAGLIYLDRVSGWAIHTARLVYSQIGQEIERKGYDVGVGRVVVPGWSKRWLAARSMAGALVRRHPRIPQLRVPTRVLEYRQVAEPTLV